MIIGFPFHDQKNTTTITCCHIIKDNMPILYVSHDEDDGMWQFMCGKKHKTNEAMVVSLEKVHSKDRTIGKIADLPHGYCAERLHESNKWEIYSK